MPRVIVFEMLEKNDREQFCFNSARCNQKACQKSAEVYVCGKQECVDKHCRRVRQALKQAKRAGMGKLKRQQVSL